jgi:hypothetical protein
MRYGVGCCAPAAPRRPQSAWSAIVVLAVVELALSLFVGEAEQRLVDVDVNDGRLPLCERDAAVRDERANGHGVLCAQRAAQQLGGRVVELRDLVALAVPRVAQGAGYLCGRAVAALEREARVAVASPNRRNPV